MKIRLISKFPHFYRIIDARVFGYFAYFFLLSFSLLFILININFEFSRAALPEFNVLASLQKNPYYGWNHAYFAQILGENHSLFSNEFSLARIFYNITNNSQTDVLGAQSPDLKYREIKVSSRKSDNDIAYWENIASQLPDYEYAYFMLSENYLAKWEKEMAQNYLNKVLKENMNKPQYIKLQKRIKG